MSLSHPLNRSPCRFLLCTPLAAKNCPVYAILNPSKLSLFTVVFLTLESVKKTRLPLCFVLINIFILFRCLGPLNRKKNYSIFGRISCLLFIYLNIKAEYFVVAAWDVFLFHVIWLFSKFYALYEEAEVNQLKCILIIIIIIAFKWISFFLSQKNLVDYLVTLNSKCTTSFISLKFNFVVFFPCVFIYLLIFIWYLDNGQVVSFCIWINFWLSWI